MPLHDLRIAARVLRKNPVFSLTAALTIALGVGASTAIFSVANAVLLRPLPYKDPGRLVVAGMELRQRNVRDLPFSNADYIDLREGTKNFFEEILRALAQVNVISVGKRKIANVALPQFHAGHNQAARIFVRKRPEQNGIGYAEDAGACAHTKGNGQGSRQRKYRV